MDIKIYLDTIKIYNLDAINPTEKIINNILVKNKDVDSVCFTCNRFFISREPVTKINISFFNCDIIKILDTNFIFHFEINNYKFDSKTLVPLFLLNNYDIYLVFNEPNFNKEVNIKYIGYKLNNIPILEFKIYNKKGVTSDNIFIKDTKIYSTGN